MIEKHQEINLEMINLIIPIKIIIIVLIGMKIKRIQQMLKIK